jgi:hypothetical protein
MPDIVLTCGGPGKDAVTKVGGVPAFSTTNACR